MSTTIRLNSTTQKIVKALASKEGKSMQTIVEMAIENYRRQKFLERLNTAFENTMKKREDWDSLRNEYIEL